VRTYRVSMHTEADYMLDVVAVDEAAAGRLVAGLVRAGRITPAGSRITYAAARDLAARDDGSAAAEVDVDVDLIEEASHVE
jgi:hypothetical protein